MAQIGLDIGQQCPSPLGIGAVGFEIDQRRRCAGTNDRMENAIGRNIMRRDRCRNRIDQKWHVVVSNRNAHDSPSARIGRGFRHNAGALGMIERCLCQDGGGIPVGAREAIGFAGKSTADKRFR